ncbi:MAG TPA: pilus assembly protein TadG-related protein [Jatrophihabitans sp.]|nr:pilus assembly protein TadG-related protein [Jatrophihabitans sp.]
MIAVPARRRRDWHADDGSTIPLILGFFLIGLLVVAGAVLASDAFTKQRDLQSICDGAALAAANSVDSQQARTQPLTGALPLAGVQDAAEHYLSREPDRSSVRIATTVTADGQTVHARCVRHVRLAFGAAIGRAGGVDEHAAASARSDLG